MTRSMTLAFLSEFLSTVSEGRDVNGVLSKGLSEGRERLTFSSNPVLPIVFESNETVSAF